jgi:AraC family transcriptional activator of pobA
MTPIPTFHLYGEQPDPEPQFWIHCETISSRSSRHKWEIRLHRHDHLFQILYIASGSGDALYDGETVPLRPPSILTLPPGVTHGFRFSRDTKGHVITIDRSHLDDVAPDRSRFAQWLSVAHAATLDARDPDANYLMRSLERFVDEFANGNSDGQMLKTYLTLVLRLLARASLSDDTTRADERERRIGTLNSLIQQHYREHKPLSFYADRLGVSVTHLNRMVRAATGLTPHDLLVVKILDQAKRELTFSMATTQEVGMRLGFEDPAYFSRFFSRHTGATPGAWRKKEKARFHRHMSANSPNRSHHES